MNSSSKFCRSLGKSSLTHTFLASASLSPATRLRMSTSSPFTVLPWYLARTAMSLPAVTFDMMGCAGLPNSIAASSNLLTNFRLSGCALIVASNSYPTASLAAECKLLRHSRQVSKTRSTSSPVASPPLRTRSNASAIIVWFYGSSEAAFPQTKKRVSFGAMCICR